MSARTRLNQVQLGAVTQSERALPPRRNIVVPIACGSAVAVLIGGVIGITVGIGSTILTAYLIRRLPDPKIEQSQRSMSAQLPFVSDLIAVCLSAGATIPHTLSTIADALPSNLGERTRQASRAIYLGAEPSIAFASLIDVPGSHRLVAAICSGQNSGTSPATAITLAATELRDEQQLDAETAANKAGIWLVLPLCLCFLPAFIVAGLIPTVISVLSQIALT